MGALPGDVLKLVLRQGLRLALTGVRSESRWRWLSPGCSQDLLFGVAPSDPFTMAGVALLLTLVALGHAGCRRIEPRELRRPSH